MSSLTKGSRVFALAGLIAAAALSGCGGGDGSPEPAVELARASAALSTSKLGPHVDNPGNANAATILNACPRVAKWLVSGNGAAVSTEIASYRSRCPGGVVVLRVYVAPSQVLFQASDGASSKAQAFWIQMGKNGLSGVPASQVDWLEGPNELDNFASGFDWYHDTNAANWFASFWSSLADLMHNAGYNPLVGSIAPGNPALGGESGFGAEGAMGPMANVMGAKAYRIGWSYHSYQPDPLVTNGVNQLDPWTLLRYRKIIQAKPSLGSYPLVLTEGGPWSGWHNTYTAAQYLSWLQAADGQYAADGSVVGMTIFEVGDPTGWPTFELDATIAPSLASYIGGTSIPAMPSNVTAVATSSTSIRVTWTDNSSNETGFRIYNGQSYASVGANVTSYTQTVSPGSYWCFSVQSFNSAGYSSMTAYACTTTPAAGGIPLNQWISIRAAANNRFVCADLSRMNPPELIANRDAVGAWEKFYVSDLGSGNVALFANANAQWVSADLNRGSPPNLISNRGGVGAWETFRWVDLGNHNFALLAQANNQYACAENAGAAPLNASRTAVGPWETFHWDPQ